MSASLGSRHRLLQEAGVAQRPCRRPRRPGAARVERCSPRKSVVPFSTGERMLFCSTRNSARFSTSASAPACRRPANRAELLLQADEIRAPSDRPGGLGADADLRRDQLRRGLSACLPHGERRGHSALRKPTTASGYSAANAVAHDDHVGDHVAGLASSSSQVGSRVAAGLAELGLGGGPDIGGVDFAPDQAATLAAGFMSSSVTSLLGQPGCLEEAEQAEMARSSRRASPPSCP